MPFSTLKDVNKEDEEDKDRQSYYVGGQGQGGGGRFAPNSIAIGTLCIFQALLLALCCKRTHLPFAARLPVASHVPSACDSDCLVFFMLRV